MTGRVRELSPPTALSGDKEAVLVVGPNPAGRRQGWRCGRLGASAGIVVAQPVVAVTEMMSPDPAALAAAAREVCPGCRALSSICHYDVLPFHITSTVCSSPAVPALGIGPGLQTELPTNVFLL